MIHTGVPTPPFTAMSLLHTSWPLPPPPGPRGGSERWCEGSWSPSWRLRCIVDPGGAKESDDVYAELGIRFLLVTYMNCKVVVSDVTRGLYYSHIFIEAGRFASLSYRQ